MQREILESIELDSWLDIVAKDCAKADDDAWMRHNEWSEEGEDILDTAFAESIAYEVSLIEYGKEMSFSARLRALVNMLRSGDYVQTVGKLSTFGGRMCATGVACELFREWNNYAEWTKWEGDSSRRFSLEKRFNYLYSSVIFIPEKVVRWYGVEMEFFSVVLDMNDNGFSFDEIADWIESSVDDMDFSNRDSVINWACCNNHLAL